MLMMINFFIIEEKFTKTSSNTEQIKFAINLLLEIFGTAETFLILANELKMPAEDDIQRVNWEIFPEGDRVWDYVEKHQKTYELGKSARGLVKRRFEFLKSLNPTSNYIGKAGFTGYVIFGFENEGIYIFNSMKYGNATYIFDDEWEKLSKMTKKQIISNHYEKCRLVHNNTWEKDVRRELGR